MHTRTVRTKDRIFIANAMHVYLFGLPQVFERNGNTKIKILALSVLRNTSGSKRSLAHSSDLLVKFLVKQLDSASRQDIWSAGIDLHSFIFVLCCFDAWIELHNPVTIGV
jgi:hypothetical protein